MPQSHSRQQTPLDKLSKRELQFVFYYVECLNATHAAIAAGYSEKSAHVSGNRLLKKTTIKEAVIFRRNLYDSAANITKESIQEELYRIATADPADMYDFQEVPVVLPNGEQAKNSQGKPMTTMQPVVKSMNTVLPSVRRAISELKWDRHGNLLSLKMHPKLKAYDMLLKSKGAYIHFHHHDHQHEHTVGRLERARAAAKKAAAERRALTQRQEIDVTPTAEPVEDKEHSHIS